MKCGQFAATLNYFATFIEGLASESTSFGLRDLARVIDLGGMLTVKAFVDRVQKYLEKNDIALGSSESQQSRLKQIRVLLLQIGCEKAASDGDLVLGLLGQSSPDATLGFFEVASAALAKKVRTGPQIQIKKSLRFDVNPLILRRYADRLTDALFDQHGFDSVVAELISKDRFSKADLKEVADRFLGAVRSYKTKNDIMKAIRLRRQQEDSQARREHALAKIVP